MQPVEPNVPKQIAEGYTELGNYMASDLRKKGLEGISLVPLLKNPAAPWERPALTTFGRNNHSVRNERFRYIRYFDGTEELYDHVGDDLEWHNLAANPQYETVKRDLARWLPVVNHADSVRTRGGGE